MVDNNQQLPLSQSNVLSQAMRNVQQALNDFNQLSRQHGIQYRLSFDQAHLNVFYPPPPPPPPPQVLAGQNELPQGQVSGEQALIVQPAGVRAGGVPAADDQAGGGPAADGRAADDQAGGGPAADDPAADGQVLGEQGPHYQGQGAVSQPRNVGGQAHYGHGSQNHAHRGHAPQN
ncbi:uncharacterized protein LOC141527733 [Cotesia typhae]|uniref:uncharacterized protein LOC141527733 n=1 Tax=Cotesia typhae TaxID=2053667 RepID=UPI003D694C42